MLVQRLQDADSSAGVSDDAARTSLIYPARRRPDPSTLSGLVNHLSTNNKINFKEVTICYNINVDTQYSEIFRLCSTKINESLTKLSGRIKSSPNAMRQQSILSPKNKSDSKTKHKWSILKQYSIEDINPRLFPAKPCSLHQTS